jgi:hypothetical protein
MRLNQLDIKLVRECKEFLLIWRNSHRKDFILALDKIKKTPNELKEVAIAKLPPMLRLNIILVLTDLIE